MHEDPENVVGTAVGSVGGAGGSPASSGDRRLATQFAVARALAESASLAEAFPRVVEAIARAEGWQAGAIWWKDVYRDVLRCVAQWQEPEVLGQELHESNAARAFARGEGIPGKTWATGLPVSTEDLEHEEAFGRAAAAALAGLSGACAFPVSERGEVVGVLEFFGAHVVPPDDVMIELMRAIGAQIGEVAGRRRAEQRLVEAERMAALGTLVGGVAHEINNPLSYVGLNLARLITLERSRRGVPDELSTHRLDVLEEARDGLQRVERIVRELKTFAACDDARLGPVDLRATLEGALRIAGHEIRQRAKLVKELADVPPARGNAARVGQVFLNLLVNAAHAIPEGEAHVNEIAVTLREEVGGRIAVEVHDTGAGISPEKVRRIFDPYYTMQLAGLGTGLGLAICRGIVTAMDGEISVESVLGAGTTFRVVLPRWEAGRDAPEGIATSPPLARATTAPPTTASAAASEVRGRVLVIDDDPQVARAMSLVLEADHEVVLAGSGREALDLLQRDPRFDAIVCDLMMPEVSGVDTYEALALVLPDLADRFVFVTGGAFTLRAGRFLASMRERCLEKPFLPEQLVELVDKRIAICRRHARGAAKKIVPPPIAPTGSAAPENAPHA